jgi:hypothetical protein
VKKRVQAENITGFAAEFGEFTGKAPYVTDFISSAQGLQESEVTECVERSCKCVVDIIEHF